MGRFDYDSELAQIRKEQGEIAACKYKYKKAVKEAKWNLENEENLLIDNIKYQLCMFKRIIKDKQRRYPTMFQSIKRKLKLWWLNKQCYITVQQLNDSCPIVEHRHLFDEQIKNLTGLPSYISLFHSKDSQEIFDKFGNHYIYYKKISKKNSEKPGHDLTNIMQEIVGVTLYNDFMSSAHMDESLIDYVYVAHEVVDGINMPVFAYWDIPVKFIKTEEK